MFEGINESKRWTKIEKIKICKKSFVHYDNFKRSIPTWYEKRINY